MSKWLWTTGKCLLIIYSDPRIFTSKAHSARQKPEIKTQFRCPLGCPCGPVNLNSKHTPLARHSPTGFHWGRGLCSSSPSSGGPNILWPALPNSTQNPGEAWSLRDQGHSQHPQDKHDCLMALEGNISFMEAGSWWMLSFSAPTYAREFLAETT